MQSLKKIHAWAQMQVPFCFLAIVLIQFAKFHSLYLSLLTATVVVCQGKNLCFRRFHVILKIFLFC